MENRGCLLTNPWIWDWEDQGCPVDLGGSCAPGLGDPLCAQQAGGSGIVGNRSRGPGNEKLNPKICPFQMKKS